MVYCVYATDISTASRSATQPPSLHALRGSFALQQEHKWFDRHGRSQFLQYIAHDMQVRMHLRMPVSTSTGVSY